MRIFLLGMLIALPAFAVKGTYAPEGELNSTCKLSFKIWDAQKKKVLSGLCSSSYLGNSTFITAEHCTNTVNQSLRDFANKLTPIEPYFICPNSEEKFTVKKVFAISEVNYGSDYDLGVVKSNKAPSIDPVLFPDSGETDKLLKTLDNCYINGYGINNEGDFGKLKAARMIEVDSHPISLNYADPPMIRTWKNIGVEGDSGGPLYCLKKELPVLLGVAHGKLLGELKYTDYHRVEKVQDWISYHKNSADGTNEIFSRLLQLKDTANSLNRCVKALETNAKLVEGQKEAVQSLNDKTQEVFQDAIAGLTIVEKDIEKVWKPMIKFWEEQDCYKAIYSEPNK